MPAGVHLLVRLLATTIAGVVVVVALLAARLSAGPLSLSFLAPGAARAIEAVTPLNIAIGGLELEWRDWQAGLLIRVRDVALRVQDDGATAPGAQGRIDELAASFSPPAILAGVIAPSIVIVHGAALTITRETDGRLATPDGSRPLSELFTRPAADRPAADDAPGPVAFLQRVEISDLLLTIADRRLDTDWRLELVSARVMRNAGRLHGDAALALAFGNERATLTAALADLPAANAPAADLPQAGAVTQATLRLNGVRPAALAPLFASLPASDWTSGWAPQLDLGLSAVDLPLQGVLTLDLTTDGALLGADATIEGGEGALAVTRSLAEAAGMPALEQRLPVGNLALQAAFAPATGAVVLRRFDIAFGPGAELRPPPPVDQRYPLQALGAVGRYEDGRLELSPVTVDLGGPLLTATATLDDVAGVPVGSVAVTATRIPVNELRRLWPPNLAPGAYDWVTTHLSDGVIPQATARAELVSRDGASELGGFAATFDVERLSVDYLPPLPPVRNVRGTARVDLQRLDITVTGGEAAGLIVRGGTIALPDLDRDPPSIAIDVEIAGSIPDTLAVLSAPPLEYPQQLGIEPAQTSGSQSTRLQMGFPLLADLDIDEIALKIDTELRNLAVSAVADGIDISDGHLKLQIDSESLAAHGTLAIAGVYGLLDVKEAFNAVGSEPQTRIEFIADDAAVAHLKRNVRQLAPLDDYIDGGTLDGLVQVELAADGTGRIDTTLDLASTVLAIPQIDWRKPAGAPATLDIQAHLQAEAITAIPSIRLLAPGMHAEGAMTLDAAGALQQLEATKLAFGRTEVRATVNRLQDGGWNGLLSGDTLDLQPLLNAGDGNGTGTDLSFKDWPRLTLAADLGTVWLNSPDPITDVQITLVHERGVWSQVQMLGTLNDGSKVELSVVPEDGTARSFSLAADNAGEVLSTFASISNIRGGRLRAEGRFDDTDPQHPLVGRLRVRGFHLVDAPILARMLNLLSLTGIGDALGGRGILFSNLDLTFSERQGVFGIFNGRAFGSALGITATGTIDSAAGTIDLRGELVPFYAVNAAFGRIPLIGSVLTGGEQGGGLFSASYSVTGNLEEPNVGVNPVSVLFPGFLRWILETFERWLGVGTRAATPETALP